jgi:mono/diheme cytochrome c family protein
MKRLIIALSVTFATSSIALADTPGMADFQRLCKTCHGDGSADTVMGKKLKIRPYKGRAELDKARILKALTNGVAPADGRGEMKKLDEKKLDASQRDAVADYVLSLTK